MSVETCEHCKGTGLVEEICPTCYSSGLDPDSPDGIDCLKCDGTGYPEVKCRRCEASGELEGGFSGGISSYQ
jgi:RecJ-like exonuclease